MKLVSTAPRSSSKQTAINLISTVLSYVVSLGISFLLTPYIVAKLGTAAYGFIGLSNTIIGYTALLTVALNSMSQRYVTLSYHKGEFDNANQYFSSTFFANVGLSLIIILILGILTLFLELIINIPPELILDVKFLFTLLFVNSAISLCYGVFGFATFIKNRLELSNLRSVGSNVIRAVLLIILYGFFPAHLWYIGIVGIVCTIYLCLANGYYHRILTPELKIKLRHFSSKRVWEMTKSGAWNLLNSLSGILNQGFELLLANIFISAYFMGVLSISKTLPFLILGFFANLGNNFQPEFIKYYAEGNMDSLKSTLLKSIRILGLFTAIPCSIVFAYGDIFYSSWLPGQDYNLMYSITCITMFGIVFAMPPQSLWYIFTMTNHVKESSLNVLKYAVLNFAIVLICVNIFDNDIVKLYSIVTSYSLLLAWRYCTFLPFYGAKVLGFPKLTFLLPLLKIVVSVAVISGVSYGFKYLFIREYNWGSFVLCSLFTLVIGLLGNYYFTLNPSDRKFIKGIITNKILRIKSA